MTRNRLRWAVALIGALATGATGVVSITSAAVGDPQPPVELGTGASSNALVPLMAASGERGPGTNVSQTGNDPKHFWVDGFDRTTDTVTWTVHVPTRTDYHARLLVNGTEGRAFELASADDRVVFEASLNGWDVVDVSALSVPAGDSQLVLRPLADGPAASIKSVELFPAKHWNRLQERVARFKAAAEPTRDRFARSGWGLMFQYGPWSYPPTGPNPAMEDHVNGFDVNEFGDMVEDTGASYVIWSVSWWTYQLAAPSSAVDAIVGNQDRTAQRDLIGQIATDLKARGIMFFLYYHTGQDSHLGYNSTDFWSAQQWPDEFDQTGSGDRSLFFANWKAIIAELGERYGRKLDGWFFDDGLVYYPADFEELGAAARAGNRQRLVSINPWVQPRLTDFQDVSFGESCVTGAPIGGNGMIPDGQQKGLLEHCMSRMEQDWGVHDPNTQINTQRNAAALACEIHRGEASQRTSLVEPDDVVSGRAQQRVPRCPARHA